MTVKCETRAMGRRRLCTESEFAAVDETSNTNRRILNYGFFRFEIPKTEKSTSAFKFIAISDLILEQYSAIIYRIV